MEIWRCISPEQLKDLCAYEMEHYGRMPDIHMKPEKPVVYDEEIDPEVVEVMQETGEVRHWPK